MPVKFRPRALQHGMGRMRESKKAGSLQRKQQTLNAMTSAVLSALRLLTLWQLHVWSFANLYKGHKLVKCRKGAEPVADGPARGAGVCLLALPRAPAGTQAPCGEGLRAGPSWTSGTWRGGVHGRARRGRVGAPPPLQQDRGEGRRRPPRL